MSFFKIESHESFWFSCIFDHVVHIILLNYLLILLGHNNTKVFLHLHSPEGTKMKTQGWDYKYLFYYSLTF